MTALTHPPLDAGFAPEFVADVLDDALAHAGQVYGIAGLQGSGKSTLAAQLTALADERGLHAVALSIDDFYLGRRDRQQLGRTVHPLLATRGPPGTHDVALAWATIDALKRGTDVALPRFDKLTDRRLPPSRWQRVTQKPDLIILEGWFLKVPAEPASALCDPINELEREDDPTGTWRAYCNRALMSYAPLWHLIDRLLFLQGPGFEVVPGWRWQQEVSMPPSRSRRGAMDRAAVEQFVLFFERVSRQALRTLPGIADRTVRIDALRRPAI
jgi:D-glycerate 3-kinase